MHMKPHLLTVLRVIRLTKNWPLYFLNRLGLLHAPRITFRLRNGLTVICRPFPIDRAPLYDVWLEQGYEPSHFGIPFDWSACNTILDIGANIGMFTLFAASRAPHAHLYSFEPDTGNFEVLIENIRTNDLESRVTLVRRAVAGATQELKMFFRTDDPGGHSIYHYTDESKEAIVPALSLDDVFKTYGLASCDYLKVDCEGAEYDILYNTSSEVLKKIRCIALEYHHFSNDPKNQPTVLVDYLRSHGFIIFPSKKSMCFAMRPSTHS